MEPTEPTEPTEHRYSPHEDALRLRKGGWHPAQIAEAVGATERQVWRWLAGDSRPLRVYARTLSALPTERVATPSALPTARVA